MRSPAPLVLAVLVSCASTGRDSGDDPSRPRRHFRFEYEAAVLDVPEGARTVRLWIPVPETTVEQRIEGLRVRGQSGAVAFDLTSLDEDLELERDGDRVSFVARAIRNGRGRSLCVTSSGAPIELELSCDITRYETLPGGEMRADELTASVRPASMIPLDGKVARVAAGMDVDRDPVAAAHALFEHTLERMRYEKPDDGEGWGRGDAEWACDARYGDCSDFHSYFIGLARAKRLPARFETGFAIPGGDEPVAEIPGYHCWAYFWDGTLGWVPVDVSEADEHPERAEQYFGRLDPDRLALSSGRDLKLTPAPPGGPLNFFVYPVAEVDGQAWTDVSKAFRRVRID